MTDMLTFPAFVLSCIEENQQPHPEPWSCSALKGTTNSWWMLWVSTKEKTNGSLWCVWNPTELFCSWFTAVTSSMQSDDSMSRTLTGLRAGVGEEPFIVLSKGNLASLAELVGSLKSPHLLLRCTNEAQPFGESIYFKPGEILTHYHTCWQMEGALWDTKPTWASRIIPAPGLDTYRQNGVVSRPEITLRRHNARHWVDLKPLVFVVLELVGHHGVRTLVIIPGNHPADLLFACLQTLLGQLDMEKLICELRPVVVGI